MLFIPNDVWIYIMHFCKLGELITMQLINKQINRVSLKMVDYDKLFKQLYKILYKKKSSSYNCAKNSGISILQSLDESCDITYNFFPKYCELPKMFNNKLYKKKSYENCVIFKMIHISANTVDLENSIMNINSGIYNRGMGIYSFRCFNNYNNNPDRIFFISFYSFNCTNIHDLKSIPKRNFDEYMSKKKIIINFYNSYEYFNADNCHDFPDIREYLLKYL
mgnify:CR=1 FL=1